MSRGAEDAALLAAAREAARAAAAVHREMAARAGVSEREWEEKGRADFVTEVDLEAERRILGVLRSRFPDHAVLAEEGTGDSGGRPDGSAGGAPIRWIIDPLDGTTNWLHGYPEYAASVAAEDAEGLRVAVVLNSATGELFEAVRGGGSRRDGEPIRVSGVRDCGRALVGTGFPFKRLELLAEYLATFSRVLGATSGIRRAGAAALDLCDVACGRLDAFFEYWLMPWDVAGGGLIVREAGGVFEPLPLPVVGGEPLPAAAGGDPPPAGAGELRAGGFLAANPHLADAFRGLVRGGR